MISDHVAGLVQGLVPAVASRLALALNHLLHAEPTAARRLMPHSGRRIELRFGAADGGLGLAAPLVFDVTPAGLLDADGSAGPNDRASDVVMTLQSQPLPAASALLSGSPPPIEVSGDSALAADIRWLLDNLRWDFEGDLERLVGPTAAYASARVGAGMAAVARGALDTVTSVFARGPGR